MLPLGPEEHLTDAIYEFWASGPDIEFKAPETWHITLGYYGENDDPVARRRWLRERIVSLPPVSLRLSGTGSFDTTRWIGVADPQGLHELAQAARTGNDEFEYTPHLTIGFGQELNFEYEGPPWTTDKVHLLRVVERGVYQVVDVIQLGAG
jgi:2'-5' RNA ligase